MITTLSDFATHERDTYKTLKAAAEKSLGDAQTALAQAQKDHEAARNDFAKLEQEADGLRKDLAIIPMPADGQALLDQLEQHIVGMREKQAEILDAEDAMAAADAKVKRARTELDRATARLAEAEKKLKEAQDRNERLAGWAEQLKKPPLDTLPTDADAALNTAPHNKTFTDAKKRVEDDIPKDLRDRAHERGLQQRKRRAAVEAAVASAEVKRLAEQNAALGAAPQAWLKARGEFDAAEAGLKDYMTATRERLDLAGGLLSRIATALPLTLAEKDHIVDATLVARGTAAAALEKARDDKLAKVEEKRAAVEEAILAALAKDPTSDSSQDNAVKNAKKELADAEKELADTNKVLALSALEKARDDAAAEKDKKQDALNAAVAASQDPNNDPAVAAAKDALKIADDKSTAAKKTFDDAAKVRTDAKKAVDDRQKDVDDAIAAAKAKVPPVNPDTDPKVKDARTALEKAKNELAKAERPLIPISGDLDAWEAAIPDSSWRMLVDREEAERLLTDLAGAKPADLLQAVKDKEAALVGALDTVARSVRSMAFLEDAVAERTALRTRAAGAAPARLLSAIRGDS